MHAHLASCAHSRASEILSILTEPGRLVGLATGLNGGIDIRRHYSDIISFRSVVLVNEDETAICATHSDIGLYRHRPIVCEG